MKIAKMPNGECEIYTAFQGEGQTIGKPCIFVRLSICNLHCKFCDTFYTWNFEGTPWGHDFAGKVQAISEQMDMTEQEVADYIKKIAGPIRRVVLTGGEPTVQQDSLAKVMEFLGDEWIFEVETNGTIVLKDSFVKRLNQINSSPKLSTSGNDFTGPDGKEISLRDNPKAIARFKELWEFGKVDLCFKFVVWHEDPERDMAEIRDWQKRHNIPNKLIYLMPQGIETQHIIEGSKVLAEICKKENYNLSTRLQVILYGTRRAV